MERGVVVNEVRLSAAGRRAEFPAIARLMTAALETSGLLSLAAGFTDNSTLPADLVGAAAAELTSPGAPRDVLQYGLNQGRPGLREAVAERLARQDSEAGGAGGRRPDPSEVMVTNGSQQALHLALQTIADPGDVVLVEEPTYFVCLEAMRGLGIEARSLPGLADGGPDLEALPSRLEAWRRDGTLARVRAVYVVTYHANPTGRSWTAAEKAGLAEVLERAGVVVPLLEDAAYRELAYDGSTGAPSGPALAAWGRFPVLHLGTLTKPFATGLKVGWAWCPEREWRRAMLHLKGHQDFGTGHFAQALVERAVAGTGFDLHLARLRPAYAEKCRVLDAALEAGGLRGLGWRWERPAGGLYLWLAAPAGVETGFESRLFAAAQRAGVLYVPGELCFAADVRRGDRVRLSFGVLGAADLREAARRFVVAAKEAAS